MSAQLRWGCDQAGRVLSLPALGTAIIIYVMFPFGCLFESPVGAIGAGYVVGNY